MLKTAKIFSGEKIRVSRRKNAHVQTSCGHKQLKFLKDGFTMSKGKPKQLRYHILSNRKPILQDQEVNAIEQDQTFF